MRMHYTAVDPRNPGVRIAAPQDGLRRNRIIVQRFDKDGEPFEYYINPEITEYSEEKESGPEGCLSVPEETGMVERSTSIIIRYRNTNSFRWKQESVEGFTAIIF